MCNLGLVWWELGHYEAAREQWHLAADRVTESNSKATALFGLGNVSLRLRDYKVAIGAFQAALALYEDIGASADVRLRILNNLLVCYGRLDIWEKVEAIAAQGRGLWPDVGRVVRGEFSCTQAEGALSRGHVDHARQLVHEAKDLLGHAVVLSWFTVRLLELALNPISPEKIFRELEDQLDLIADVGLQVAIRLRMVELSVHWRSDNITKSLLGKLRSLYRTLG